MMEFKGKAVVAIGGAVERDQGENMNTEINVGNAEKGNRVVFRGLTPLYTAACRCS